jgi:hypothetical protein
VHVPYSVAQNNSSPLQCCAVHISNHEYRHFGETCHILPQSNAPFFAGLKRRKEFHLKCCCVCTIFSSVALCECHVSRDRINICRGKTMSSKYKLFSYIDSHGSSVIFHNTEPDSSQCQWRHVRFPVLSFQFWGQEICSDLFSSPI